LEWPRIESCLVGLKAFPKRFKLTGVTDFISGQTTVDMSSWFADGSDEFLTLTTTQELELLRKIRRNSKPLGELADVQRGVTPFHLTETAEHKNSQPAFGGTIRRYTYDPGPVRYIRYDESLAEFKPARYFHGRRILLRELISRQFRLQAMMVNEDFVTNKSMQSILLESVGDTLREQGWEIALDPGKKEGPKQVRPGEKMLVLRPTHSKQPAPVGRQARIEQILVDLQLEATRLALMDASEARGVLRAILDQHLVQVAEIKTCANFGTLKLNEIEAVPDAFDPAQPVAVN